MGNTKCRGLLLYWAPVFLYAGLIFWLSSFSHPRVPAFRLSDKVYHVILYSVFGFLFIRAFQPMEKAWGRARVLLTACLGALIYGAIDEFHQYFVPRRSADWSDLVADGLAGLLGGIFFLYYVRKGK